MEEQRARRDIEDTVMKSTLVDDGLDRGRASRLESRVQSEDCETIAHFIYTQGIRLQTLLEILARIFHQAG